MGILLNAVAIVTNGGYMPVWEPSIVAAGLTPGEVGSTFHRIVGATATGGIPSDFLAQAGPLGDIIPIPIPFIRNVASIGDLFLGAGLGFFLFAVTVRSPVEYERAALDAVRRRLGELVAPPELVVEAATEPARRSPASRTRTPSLVSAAALERPQMLGGSSRRGGGPSVGTRYDPALPSRSSSGSGGTRTSASPSTARSARCGPASSSARSATGSTRSRWHSSSCDATGSAIAVGAVFLVATLPNLLFGPIAGGLVDRWDHREVMIVSDLLRAGLVLLIPLAAVTNLVLAYPLVFLVTTVSIFFRPAKGAILPRIVAQDDLVPANSALWVGETFADIFGYVVAGLFVALLGSQLPLAFWVDWSRTSRRRC